MTKSKRPMSKRHEPHDQNKTPHEETGRTAAVAGHRHAAVAGRVNLAIVHEILQFSLYNITLKP